MIRIHLFSLIRKVKNSTALWIGLWILIILFVSWVATLDLAILTKSYAQFLKEVQYYSCMTIIIFSVLSIHYKFHKEHAQNKDKKDAERHKGVIENQNANAEKGIVTTLLCNNHQSNQLKEGIEDVQATMDKQNENFLKLKDIKDTFQWESLETLYVTLKQHGIIKNSISFGRFVHILNQQETCRKDEINQVKMVSVINSLSNKIKNDLNAYKIESCEEQAANWKKIIIANMNLKETKRSLGNKTILSSDIETNREIESAIKQVVVNATIFN